MQDLGHDLVLHAAGGSKAHRPTMRADRDLRGAAQARLFGAALVEPHVIEQMGKRGEFLIDPSGLPRVHAQSIDPAENARIEFVVHAHRIENVRTILHETREDLVDIGDRKRVLGFVSIDRPIGACARAIPEFPQLVALAHEQQVLPWGRPGTSTATASGSGNPVK